MDTPSPIPSEILAAIAAAVHVVFGPGARIADLTPHADMVNESHMFSWSLEGRRMIHYARKVR